MTDKVTMILGGRNEQISGKEIFQAYISEQRRLYPDNFQITFPLEEGEDNQVEVRVAFKEGKALVVYGVKLLEFLPIARHELDVSLLSNLEDLVTSCQAAFTNILMSDDNTAEIKNKINAYIESKFASVFKLKAFADNL